MRLGPLKVRYDPTPAAGNVTHDVWMPTPFAILLHAVSFTLNVANSGSPRAYGLQRLRGTLQLDTIIGGVSIAINAIYLVSFCDRPAGYSSGSQVNFGMPPTLIPEGTLIRLVATANGAAADIMADIQVLYQEVLDW